MRTVVKDHIDMTLQASCAMYIKDYKITRFYKGQTIRKLMGGGGGGRCGRSTKKYSRKGKLNEKNSCTPIDPKKYSYKEFDNEKKFLLLENSPPPHNFSNGPSLNNY